MSSIVIAGDTSGSVTLQAPAVAGSTVLNLPSTSGTIQTSGAGYTTNGVAYATSTSTLSTGSALTFNGTAVGIGGSTITDSNLLNIQGSTVTSNVGIVLNKTNATAQIWGIQNNGALTFFDYTASATRLQLDTSGNLGLGVTPSAWSEGRAIERRFAGTADWGYLQAESYRTTNAYFNGGWKYGGTGAACKYGHVGGTHEWSTAPSGTAGTAITFTQAMTLDATNGLQVGTSTGNSGANGIHATGVIMQGASGLSQAQIVISGGNAIQAQTLGVGYENLRLSPLGGRVLCGTTSAGFSNSNSITIQPPEGYCVINHSGTSSGTNYIWFGYNGGSIGTISQNGTTAVAYNTSSDYRLKNNIAPMTGALEKVALLKPCTYKWNVDNSDGEGFIAHELAEVCPHAVNGEKDAIETYVDENGNEQTRPVYQGIDTSFLVATLTAAIQEQQALITTLTDRISVLENK